MTSAQQPPEAEPDSDPAARFAEILAYGSSVWFSLGSRWYERARERTTWTAADVVGDCTDLVEHLTPLAERTIDLGIEALRPYARTFRQQSND
jgi:hypothetical protein